MRLSRNKRCERKLWIPGVYIEHKTKLMTYDILNIEMKAANKG
jgi:hypothetical protein